VLDGVSIEDGRARAQVAFPPIGGGLLIDEHSVDGVTALVLDCIFRDNGAYSGGGAIATRADPEPSIPQQFHVPLEIRRCCFERNELIEGPPLCICTFIELRGGGAVASDADLTIVRSSFVDNSVGEAGWGGAVSVESPSSLVRIVNSVFRANLALPVNSGGARGGAIYVGSTEVIVELTGCVIVDNMATAGTELLESVGGGVAVVGGITTLVIENSTIANNSATDYGGGAFAQQWGSPNTPGTTVIVRNSIVYGNQADFGTPFRQQVFTPNFVQPGGPQGDSLIEYSCVEGVDTLDYEPGNLDTDPGFASSGGDYRLAPTSLLINAGATALIPDDLADVNESNGTSEPLPWDIERSRAFDRMRGHGRV